jgi:hypothetical protein
VTSPSSSPANGLRRIERATLVARALPPGVASRGEDDGASSLVPKPSSAILGPHEDASLAETIANVSRGDVILA